MVAQEIVQVHAAEVVWVALVLALVVVSMVVATIVMVAVPVVVPAVQVHVLWDVVVGIIKP